MGFLYIYSRSNVLNETVKTSFIGKSPKVNFIARVSHAVSPFSHQLVGCKLLGGVRPELRQPKGFFLRRDAMHNAAYTRRGVCLSRSCIISSDFFHLLIMLPPQFWFLHTKHYGKIPTGSHLTQAFFYKNRNF